jgi:hypothetical protein
MNPLLNNWLQEWQQSPDNQIPAYDDGTWRKSKHKDYDLEYTDDESEIKGYSKQLPELVISPKKEYTYEEIQERVKKAKEDAQAFNETWRTKIGNVVSKPMTQAGNFITDFTNFAVNTGAKLGTNLPGDIIRATAAATNKQVPNWVDYTPTGFTTYGARDYSPNTNGLTGSATAIAGDLAGAYLNAAIPYAGAKALGTGLVPSLRFAGALGGFAAGSEVQDAIISNTTPFNGYTDMMQYTLDWDPSFSNLVNPLALYGANIGNHVGYSVGNIAETAKYNGNNAEAMLSVIGREASRYPVFNELGRLVGYKLNQYTGGDASSSISNIFDRIRLQTKDDIRYTGNNDILEYPANENPLRNYHFGQHPILKHFFPHKMKSVDDGPLNHYFPAEYEDLYPNMYKNRYRLNTLSGDGTKGKRNITMYKAEDLTGRNIYLDDNDLHTLKTLPKEAPEIFEKKGTKGFSVDIAGHDSEIKTIDSGDKHVVTTDLWHFTPKDYSYKWLGGNENPAFNRLFNIRNKQFNHETLSIQDMETLKILSKENRTLYENGAFGGFDRTAFMHNIGEPFITQTNARLTYPKINLNKRTSTKGVGSLPPPPEMVILK